jgi:hypothetical protein
VAQVYLGMHPQGIPQWLGLVALLLCPMAGTADDFFRDQVEPVLRQHCYECHSHAGKIKGGLVLDSRSGWQTGGDSGPAVVPGSPEKSLLIQAVRHSNPNLEMPPKAKLSAAEVAILEDWVKRGAPDPRAVVAEQKATKKGEIDLESGRRHWAFQPLREVAPPAVGDSAWAVNEVDPFILTKLEAKGLSPAAPADRATLIRRLSFDLTGLPPDPQEVESFCRDSREDAVERLVDRLLASPRFGERWGRHWLDVARYSDSIGGGMNHVLDDAWRYRDYVVASFNADKPYDRFVAEQIAGDLLPSRNETQRIDQLAATGFLLLGVIELGEYDREKLRMDIVDEQLDTLGKTFLGLTLGCARCHDHKFDPVPTADYYAMAGILRSTNPFDEKKSAGLFASLRRLPLPQDPATTAAIARATAELAALKKESAAAKEAAKRAAAPMKEAAEKRAEDLQKEVRRREPALAAMTPMVLAVGDEAEPKDSPVLIRGDVHNAGPIVPRGFLSLARLDGVPAVPPQQSGRLELARWITAPENPLPARVMVNRVWHWLMGAGLVRSVDNFGIRGESPSHPELLDHLAGKFIERGWSVKALVREIVLSQTYRQSSRADRGSIEADPDNQLQSRHQRRRLEAEEIHDALLYVGGTLDDTLGGPTNTRTGRLGTEGQDAMLERDPGRRRGLYQPIYRGGLAPDLFRVFDFPDGGLVTGRRNVTTVAPQALFLMNSPVILDHAQRCAVRVIQGAPDDTQRIRLLSLLLFGRAPSEQESAAARAFLSSGTGEQATAWAALCQSFMISNPFLFVE